MLYSVALACHILVAVIWVGGMFFAYMVLRPSAAELLEPPDRLALWSAVFRRFFRWVWCAILVLLVTGNLMLFGFLGGMQQAGIHVHLMNGLAWIMILLFVYLNLGPVKRLIQSTQQQDWSRGGANLVKIRRVVGINLTLGLLVILVAAGGKNLPL